MDVRKHILTLLRPLGITKKYVGCLQLVRAVEIILESPNDIHNLHDQVYSVIAAEYHCNKNTVERNIITISQVAWRNNPTYLEEIAGHSLYRAPSPLRFIDIFLSNVLRQLNIAPFGPDREPW